MALKNYENIISLCKQRSETWLITHILSTHSWYLLVFSQVTLFTGIESHRFIENTEYIFSQYRSATRLINYLLRRIETYIQSKNGNFVKSIYCYKEGKIVRKYSILELHIISPAEVGIGTLFIFVTTLFLAQKSLRTQWKGETIWSLDDSLRGWLWSLSGMEVIHSH